MLKVLTDYTFVYFGDSKYEADLGIKNIGDKITYEALKENNVTILIIGQPRSPFYPEEVEAIKKWLEEGGHALWIAGDSDYGTSGVNTINFVDSVLNQLNMTNLRLDQASVEDPPVSNAGAPYRVVAYADPWGGTHPRGTSSSRASNTMEQSSPTVLVSLPGLTVSMVVVTGTSLHRRRSPRTLTC
ncbi:hypothetical protein [Thermococcus sp. JCM 11816]|uniref:hypothetical protein n=1 Tax=Thermococcus sp. (strain JCM 11816 / KS-1) TaxID=1295125 RepID=UPI0006CF6A31